MFGEGEEMPMPKPDCPRLGTGIASAENRRLRRLLRIFVTIVCTNLVGLASALAEDAPLTPIPSIDLSLTNQLITVQALITNIREPTGPRSPYIVTLTESNATVPLVYWSDMETQLSSKVKLGNIINAEVKVSTYRHNIQLRISSNDAIRWWAQPPYPRLRQTPRLPVLLRPLHLPTRLRQTSRLPVLLRPLDLPTPL